MRLWGHMPIWPERSPPSEYPQAVVLLGAGGTALEVRAQPGDRDVGVPAMQLEVDVLVDLREAFVAEDLGLRGPE